MELHGYENTNISETAKEQGYQMVPLCLDGGSGGCNLVEKK